MNILRISNDQALASNSYPSEKSLSTTFEDKNSLRHEIQRKGFQISKLRNKTLDHRNNPPNLADRGGEEIITGNIIELVLSIIRDDILNRNARMNRRANYANFQDVPVRKIEASSPSKKSFWEIIQNVIYRIFSFLSYCISFQWMWQESLKAN